MSVHVAACDGNNYSSPPDDAQDAGADGDAGDPFAERFFANTLVTDDVVTDAVGANLDGEGPMTIVVSLEGGGLASFVSGASGELLPAHTALEGSTFTGLGLAELDGSGTLSVVAFSTEKILYALDGDLAELWSVDLTAFTDTGEIIPGDQDGDGDDDISTSSSDFTQMINVETRDGTWPVRDAFALPTDILSIAAGDLGGNPHDEYLFLGTGGLVEAVSVGDFNYIDDRPLSGTSHARATFGDFDSDGDGDVAISTPAQIELWTGDGETNIVLATTAGVGESPVRDLAAFPRDASDTSLVIVVENGFLALVHIDEEGNFSQGTDNFATAEDALRILVGDVNDDDRSDAVIVTTGGRAFTWKSPE